MDNSSKVLFAMGLGAVGAAGMWWWLRGRVAPQTLPDPESFKTPVAKVAKLYLYPVKSCHRIELESSKCLTRGLKYDRCWVIVNKDDHFVSQRTNPRMALIQPSLEYRDADDSVLLHLTAPDMPELVLENPGPDATPRLIKVHQIQGEGADMGEEAAGWVSEFLDLKGCRMYYMSPQHKPRVTMDDPRWRDMSFPGEETSFADACPLLLASESSLELLNSRMEQPLSIERFRPNIILTGCLPHSEDKWTEVRIGKSAVLRGMKPCSRCKMTTVDQETGQFSGPEPLQTLRMYAHFTRGAHSNIKGYRLHETVYECETDKRFGNSPLFGFNYSVLLGGDISVGDTVYTK